MLTLFIWKKTETSWGMKYKTEGGDKIWFLKVCFVYSPLSYGIRSEQVPHYARVWVLTDSPCQGGQWNPASSGVSCRGVLHTPSLSVNGIPPHPEFLVGAYCIHDTESGCQSKNPQAVRVAFR